MGEAEQFQITIDCELSPDGNIQMRLEGPQNAVLVLKVLAVTQKAILDKMNWAPPQKQDNQPAKVMQVVVSGGFPKN